MSGGAPSGPSRSACLLYTSITATCVQHESTNSGSCVMTTCVMPRSRKWRIPSATCCMWKRSSPLVGSSETTSARLVASAWAIDVYKRQLFDTALEALSWSLSPVKKQSNPFDDFRSEWLVGAIADASCKRRKKEGRFQYSNFGYSVLGYALGRAMGSTYHDLIVSYIENELRLSSTTFGPGRLPMVCLLYTSRCV